LYKNFSKFSEICFEKWQQKTQKFTLKKNHKHRANKYTINWERTSGGRGARFMEQTVSTIYFQGQWCQLVGENVIDLIIPSEYEAK